MSDTTTTGHNDVDLATDNAPTGWTEELTDANQPCGSCPHPWPGHDALSMRFCTATAASSSNRGCICR